MNLHIRELTSIMASQTLRATSVRRLKDILLARKGMFIPESDVKNLPKEIFEMKPTEQNGVRMTTLNHDIPRIQVNEIIAYLKANFLTTAPVPRALGLHKSHQTSTEVNQFIHQEFETLINSGVTTIIEKDGKLVGVAENIFWTRDDSYELVEDATMREWHNTAAEIAMETDTAHPELIWRDYQWQFTYNAFQKQMRRLNSPHGIFFSGISKSKEVQGNKEINGDFLFPMQKILAKYGGLTCAQSTHKYITKSMYELLHNSKTVEEAPFREQILQMSGKRVFQHLDETGGIGVIVGKPEST